MGCGRQDELAGKSGITLDDKKKRQRRALWAISHPKAWSKCLISKVLPDLVFSVFHLGGNPILI